MKQLKKMSQRGLLDPEQEDPFSLFVASTNIRYCYYNETQNILGNTFGMAVLQVNRGIFEDSSSSAISTASAAFHLQCYLVLRKPSPNAAGHLTRGVAV